MKIIYSRCAGLDVHKNTVDVCVRIQPAGSKKIKTEFAKVCTFGEDLERLHKFLRQHQVRRVIIESTGVYWLPLWNVLENRQWKYDLVLVNPQHVRALAGHKTDRQDSQRLAELGQYDMVRASFVPPVEIRRLRDLTRRRTVLCHDWNRLTNRIRRQLETANVKLCSVMSSVTSLTGRLILRAIADGESNPERLADLAQGSLKRKKEDLKKALPKNFSPHFRWLLSELLVEMSELESRLARVEAQIREAMIPYADRIKLLCTIPTVKEITAWTLIAELGVDMSRFPSASHCASWAGLCPGNRESAGKRQSGRTRKGNRYLRRALVQNAWAVAHIRDQCLLTDLFYRIAGRQGMKKAAVAVAVAHQILIIAYCLLRDRTTYKGPQPRSRHREFKLAQRLIRRLDRLGHPVVPVKRPDAATAEQCGVCFRWGIPCFHQNPKPLRTKLQLPANPGP